jgi:hypothetical protein
MMLGFTILTGNRQSDAVWLRAGRIFDVEACVKRAQV